MSNQSKSNWHLLSEYRNQLFGCAILSVMFYHFTEHVEYFCPNKTAALLAKCYDYFMGSIGVEMFLFLSGMGLYFSMSRNDDVKQFYQKRLRRVLVPYLIWGLIFWVWKDIFIYHESFGQLILDYTTLSLWLQGNKNIWYISFILVMYLLFPLIFRLLRKENPRRDLYAVLLVCVPFAVTIGLKLFANEIYSHVEIAAYRIPVFALGTYYGQAIAENKPFSKFDKGLLIFGIIAKLCSFTGAAFDVPVLDKIPFRAVQCFYVFFIMLLFLLFLRTKAGEKCSAALVFCGKYSLELYITHVTLRTLMNAYGFETYVIPYYAVCILLSFVCSIGLSKVTDLLLSGKKKSA